MCCGVLLLQMAISDEETAQTEQKPSSIVFNNPKLLKNSKNKEYDGYIVESGQIIPDPQRFGGILIQDESHKLAIKLRSLSNQELGVSKMQVSRLAQ